MPFVSSGTTNALMPRARAPGSVQANTIATSATSPLATQTLVPLITQPLPSCRATVCWLAASDPALASDSAKAPIDWPVARRPSHRSRCAGDPNSASGSATSELLTDRMTDSVALACATASMAMQ